MDINYSTITELPKTKVSQLQLKRSFQRYMFARKHCEGGKVIEIGCGGGQGLNLLVNVSDELVGYDIDESNINICSNTYRDDHTIKIFEGDVEKIEFDAESVQTFLLFETIYYLKDPSAFFSKLYNALKPGGNIIICTANKDWHSFNPSPFSTKYFSTRELYELGKKHLFDVETFASFPDKSEGLIDEVLNMIKRIIVKLGLMPKSMNAKLIFKRIFSGKMVSMPEKLVEGTIEYIEPQKTDPYEEDIYNTAIFALFTKKS